MEKIVGRRAEVSAGFPIGVQFFAPFADEETLFQLTGQLERERPWAHKHPPSI